MIGNYESNEIFGFRLSGLARRRMQQRGVRREALIECLLRGRRVQTRGAVIYVLGRREVEAAEQKGLRLDYCQGLHVVCSHDRTVLTVYRNQRQLNLRDTKFRRPVRRDEEVDLKQAA